MAQRGSPFAPFAWLSAIQAAERGDCTQLAARLADPGINLTMEERNFIRVHGFVPPGRKRGPQPLYQVTATNKSLEIARTVIRYSKGYRRGMVEGALRSAAEEHGIEVSTVKKHVCVARRFSDGGWWETRCSMTRNGKADKPF
jgi:hypothetical protein